MTAFLIKILTSAVIIGLVTEIARRSPTYGGADHCCSAYAVPEHAGGLFGCSSSNLRCYRVVYKRQQETESRMRIYTQSDIDTFEDRYEYELSLNLHTIEQPYQIIEDLNIVSFDRSTIIPEKLAEQYTLVLLVPVFPRFHVLRPLKRLGSNTTFELLEVTQDSLNQQIIDFLVENELSFPFFLIKHVERISFALPHMSNEYLVLTNGGENELIELRLEFGGIVHLFFK
ncbi:hypothetical protein [Exiguobacterium antarcticum]|uniref:hypothetical protein n=1 Tax=Exiguobacterium antarcticum TaxID=132920 RepID=UPI00047DF79E|nr:hypothetical protein [Exiguobacterium antarcticum]